MPLYDIVGGIGIQLSENPEYQAMQRLENCWLDLRESGTFPVTIEIRYVTLSESRLNKPIWHIGCKFIDLSPANETMIQRFMARIEVERRALSLRADSVSTRSPNTGSVLCISLCRSQRAN